MLRCPVCHQPLSPSQGCYRCPKGHSFDLASSGYLNLLLPNKRHSSHPGDSREMILARRDFLARGYYDFLREFLCRQIEECLAGQSGSTLIDIGCGEGYYTQSFTLAAKAVDPGCHCYGLDLAKDGLKTAAKRDKDTLYLVASLGDMPFSDQCANLLVNVFAPYSDEEFARVLAPGGYLITAVPAENHLFGLKSFLYEKPYYNILAPYDLPHFTLVSQQVIEKQVTISPGQDIYNLFQMTPYFWKTSSHAVERLKNLEQLDTPLHFGIIVYRRNSLD